MKLKLNYFTLLFWAMLAMLVSSCDDEEDPPAVPVNNIANILNNPGFSTLRAALERANLVEVFEGDTPYTVFAPTDAAFNAYLTANGLTAEELLNSSELAAILQYHVVPGSVQSSQLTNGGVETLTGESVYINTNSGVVINGKSRVTTPDIIGINGVVHSINTVLDPAAGTIAEIASSNTSFSTLVSLLGEFDLAGALGGAGPFTVFAPTDEAFAKIEGVLATLTDEEKEAIVRFHVIPNTRAFSNDLSSGRFATLNDAKGIDIEVSGGTITVNGNEEINPASANINATNGVIHVIDDVLIPPSTITEFVSDPANADFSTLLTAVGEAGLAELLGSDGPFTVFAPTNAAFTAYLTANELTVEDLLASDSLGAILEYHVVPSAVLSSALSNGAVTTANGQDIYVNVDNGVVINGIATVSTPDVEVYNGVIHVINAVLEPAEGNIVETASAAGNFTTLLSLLETYELAGALEGDGPFTVFAPTDAALEGVDLSGFNVEEIKDILRFHVVQGRAFSSDLMSQDYTTLNARRPLSVDLTGEAVSINGQEGILSATNINATNGVIHVIDEIMLPRRSIVDIAFYNEDFSTLVEALTITELATVLDTLEAAKATVFAPTNAAFAAFIAANDDIADAAALLASPALADILLHHVIFAEESVLSTDLVNGGDGVYYPTVHGAAVRFNAVGLTLTDGQENDVPLVANSLDLEESNGVVHVLDGVLVPPFDNVAEIAVAIATDEVVEDREFTVLVSLLQRAELVETLSDADADFTVFAPTDQAFTDLLAELGLTSADELTDAQVTDILLYHVLGERVFSSDLSDGAEVTTLSNDATFTVNIGIDVTITDASGDTATDATVTATDIQGTNGVIHVIDKVILPN